MSDEQKSEIEAARACVCGETKIDWTFDPNRNLGHFLVCPECNRRGPMARSREEATEAWNKEPEYAMGDWVRFMVSDRPVIAQVLQTKDRMVVTDHGSIDKAYILERRGAPDEAYADMQITTMKLVGAIIKRLEQVEAVIRQRKVYADPEAPKPEEWIPAPGQ